MTLNALFAAGPLQEAMEIVCADQTQTELVLNLSSSKSLVDVTPLAKLAELPSLQQLTLDLRYCYKLPSSLQGEFSSLTEFLAACESGALRLGLCRHDPEFGPLTCRQES